MSEHSWVHENLDAYVAGALSSQECSRVERHLDSCTECAHARTEISEMDQLVEGIFTRVRPDVGLEDRAIQTLRKAPRPRPSWMRVVAAAAAVLLLGMIGGGVQFAMNGTLPIPGLDKMEANGQALDKRRSYFGALGFAKAHHGANRGGEDALEVHPPVSPESEGKNLDRLAMTYYSRDMADRIESAKGDSYAMKAAISKGAISGLTSAGTLTAESENGKAIKDIAQLRDNKESPKVTLEVREQEKADKPAERRPLMPDPKVTFFDSATLTNSTAKLATKKADFEPRFYDLDTKKLQMDDQEAKLRLRTLVEPHKGALEKLDKTLDKDIKDRVGGGKGPVPGLPSPENGMFRFPLPSSTAPLTPPSPPATYFPMVPPPVAFPSAPPGDKAPPSKRDDGAGREEKKPGDEKGIVSQPKAEQPGQTKPAPKQEPVDMGRKIIRTGEMEFESDSFDACIVVITKLIKSKGGFVATVNSDKLPNGKTKGSIVVRMPPQVLDDFILDLRAALAKTSELKNQRLGSQDVTKAYTDIESRLRAARAIEDRLINIIKTGRGEIKDLVAAERELGVWRTKIEEMEGEIRYYSNQVALSTLTIQIYEKEIQAPTAIVVTETVTMRIEVDDVGKAHKTAMKLVDDLKGRITRAELKQHTAGQFLSILHAEIPPTRRDEFIAQLAKLGIVSDRQENQRQTMEGGTGKVIGLKPRDADVVFQITMNNTANIRPRLSADLKIATTDVPGAYTDLLAKITEVGGQVRDGKLNEQDKLNINAYLDFNVPTAEKTKIDKLLEKIGTVLERINIRAPVSELSTEKKFGYTLLLRDFASIPPRQAVVETIATLDVPVVYAKLRDAIAKAKGQIADSKLNEQDRLNITARLEFTVPAEEKATIEKLLESVGTLLSRDNVQAPANQLATTKKFGFSLILRDFASIPPSKATQLTAATSDVPASYAKLLDAITKAKGQLVDAKLNEQDRLNVTAQIDFSVPTDQKETIDKLIESFGAILSRTNVQLPMNSLSIAKKFGFSVTLRDFANIPPTHATVLTVAAADVPANYAKLVDAVVKAKGQISVARLDEQDKLNISAVLNFTVPIAEKQTFDKLLADMGTLLSRKNEQAPQNALTTERKFGYAVDLRDFAKIPPRETFHIQLAAVDVPSSYKELQDAIVAAKGLDRGGQIIEDNKVKVEASLAFDVPAAERQAIEKLFGKVGAVLSRTSSQIPVTELATDQKVGYKLTIRSTASILPREVIAMKLDVKDVDAKAAEVKEIVNAGKGRIIDSNIDRHENGQVSGILKIEVPFASQDVLLKQIRGVGTIVSQQAKRNSQVPENDLTTSHIYVTLNGTTPVIPNDEGLGSYVRTSLYMSFRIFAVCLMLIILGVSAVLPWALVVWLLWKGYQRVFSNPSTEAAPIDGPPTPGPAQA